MFEFKSARVVNDDILFDPPTSPIDLVYVDPPFFTQDDKGDFDDRWPSMELYLEFILSRAQVAWNALRPGGNFLMHLDWHGVHYVKVLLDAHFGYDNFQNEIIWKYNSGGGSKRRMSRKHDNILWYTKPGGKHTYNVIREPYATPNVEGREGFHPDGKMLSDVWTDIGFIGTGSTERVGYSTQKPLKLLRRFIELFSNEGDTVLDYCCGSGTTGVAALQLDRSCIMYDVNPRAHEIASRRVQEALAEPVLV